MGMYQLIFMDSVPEYAAVSETVQMAKICARQGKTYQRCPAEFYPQRQATAAGRLGYGRLPVCRLFRCAWIVRLWLDAYGEQETEPPACGIRSDTGAVCVRVNPLRTTAARSRGAARRGRTLVKPAPHTAHALLVRGSGLWRPRLICVAAFRWDETGFHSGGRCSRHSRERTVLDVCGTRRQDLGDGRADGKSRALLAMDI